MASFKVGQRVKVVSSKDELAKIAAEETVDKIGIVESSDDDILRYRVHFSPQYYWLRASDLVAVDELPATIDAPKPLLYQEHTENEPKSVRRVLLGEFGELAMRQPHLFFAGSYESICLINMQGLDTPYIRISDSADEDGDYLVFVIAEGQA